MSLGPLGVIVNVLYGFIVFHDSFFEDGINWPC